MPVLKLVAGATSHHEVGQVETTRPIDAQVIEMVDSQDHVRFSTPTPLASVSRTVECLMRDLTPRLGPIAGGGQAGLTSPRCDLPVQTVELTLESADLLAHVTS